MNPTSIRDGDVEVMALARMKLSRTCPIVLTSKASHWMSDPPEAAGGQAEEGTLNTSPSVGTTWTSRAHGK